MSPTLNALGGALLLLTWQADPGTTTTVQTSENLLDWSTLPLVIVESKEEESLSLERIGPRLFARLRRSGDGDTNANGLPDIWELETFGLLDIDPAADPDGDGVSTFDEWQAGTGPLDFFNGTPPLLYRASAYVWEVPADTLSSQSLFLHVTRPDHTPWANAPVHLVLDSGRAGLVHVSESPTDAVAELTVRTDSLGRIHLLNHDIRTLGAESPGTRETLLICAGDTRAEVVLHTVPAIPPEPPRNVSYTRDADGSLSSVSWSGTPAGATAFVVEERDENGNWISVAEVSMSELPLPDPITHRYTLHLN